MLRRTLFWRHLLEERWEEGLRCYCSCPCALFDVLPLRFLILYPDFHLILCFFGGFFSSSSLPCLTFV